MQSEYALLHCCKQALSALLKSMSTVEAHPTSAEVISKLNTVLVVSFFIHMFIYVYRRDNLNAFYESRRRVYQALFDLHTSHDLWLPHAPSA